MPVRSAEDKYLPAERDEQMKDRNEPYEARQHEAANEERKPHFTSRKTKPAESVSDEDRADDLPNRAGDGDEHRVAERPPEVDSLRSLDEVFKMKLLRVPIGRYLEYFFIPFQRYRNHPEERIQHGDGADEKNQETNRIFQRIFGYTVGCPGIFYYRRLGHSHSFHPLLSFS